MPKLNFEALNYFNPLQGPTHPSSDPIVSKPTEQVKMYGFIMACIELYDTGQNPLSDLKAGFGYGFPKIYRHTH